MSWYSSGTRPGSLALVLGLDEAACEPGEADQHQQEEHVEDHQVDDHVLVGHIVFEVFLLIV